jgi:tRNA(Ile)-lysidine synthase
MIRCMNPADPLSFVQHLAHSWPPSEWREVSVIVAVSGGPDSVALLRAMHALKAEAGGPGRLIVAHFNHHLRSEADEDQAFVRDLAGRLELPFELGEADVAQLAAMRGDGVEAAAREARYEFFQRVAQHHGARYVATAHTADDQIETVLMNILRGTGLAGLAGMPRARLLGGAVSLLRPLLAMRREEVLKYLDELGQQYRTDSTNANHDFTRNRLRHELLPLVREKYNPDIEGALERLSQIAGDAQQLIERLAGELLDRCLLATVDREIRLSLPPLAGIAQHLLREMFVALWQRMGWPLQSMGFAEWNWLASMAQESECHGKRSLPGNITVQRRGSEMLFSK